MTPEKPYSVYQRIQQMNGHCPLDCGCPDSLTADRALKCWAAANGGKWVRFEKNERYRTGG